jgi:hypothetical protein
VLPNLALLNIILMPTLRDEIIAAQRNYEVMNHIKQRMKEGDPNVACVSRGCGRDLMVQGKVSSTEEGSSKEEGSR